MKRMVMVLTVGALFLAFSATVALAAVGRGTPGPDTIWGTSGDDSLYGYGGDDTLEGGYGDDLLYGGYDYLSGGYGNDRLYGGDKGGRIYGGANDDLVVGGRGRDLLHGGSGNDSIHANRDGVSDLPKRCLVSTPRGISGPVQERPSPPQRPQPRKPEDPDYPYAGEQHAQGGDLLGPKEPGEGRRGPVELPVGLTQKPHRHPDREDHRLGVIGEAVHVIAVAGPGGLGPRPAWRRARYGRMPRARGPGRRAPRRLLHYVRSPQRGRSVPSCSPLYARSSFSTPHRYPLEVHRRGAAG